MRKALKIILPLIAVLVLYLTWLNFQLDHDFRDMIIVDIQNLENAQAVLVPGASVTKSKKPSPVLIQRLERALDLYRNKKVKKILLSGDSESPYYDEVNVMKDYILQRKVKPEDIFLDHSGLRTLDSVYRSKFIFNIQNMVIVSQQMYLPRALFLANHYGIKAQGYAADLGDASISLIVPAREFLARYAAIVDVYLLRKKPAYLGKTYSIEGDGRETWSR
ncbi:MAG: YdcF family protein [Leptospiraceae bacterium]|nr:YdcF family protein [Leptospiraceae bacterium]